jgi:hypothetical protein
MIVIPPIVELEDYFIKIAKANWTKYTYNNPNSDDEIKKNHNTLVICCDLDMAEEKVSIKLHYRFIRDILYCFVEEV